MILSSMFRTMLRPLARAASWLARILGEPYPGRGSTDPADWVHLMFHEDAGGTSFRAFDSEHAAAVYIREHPEEHAAFYGAFVELGGFLGRAIGHQERRGGQSFPTFD